VMADAGLQGAGVLSGNRNFEGRVQPKMAAGYLASPPLVVAYALLGTIMRDIRNTPLGKDTEGNDVFLRDIWPADEEVAAVVRSHVRPEFFSQRNKTLWLGTHHWQQLAAQGSVRYAWEPRSTYLLRPQYTQAISRGSPESLDIHDARTLMVLGDNVTTDHISPVGRIPVDSVAGRWLLERGEAPDDLNQYSTRRSNHEVMLRGAFTTRNLRNLLLGDTHPDHGGAYAWTADGMSMLPVYEAAQTHLFAGTPLVLFAGLNYGAGSSRDWAAKAPSLLGVRAIVARSFERIHRSNLIGMGIFPLEFVQGDSAGAHSLTGRERLDITGLDRIDVGNNPVPIAVTRADASRETIEATLRIDSEQELMYLRNGGILPYVIRKTVSATRVPR